jgi:hypothetical protein
VTSNEEREAEKAHSVFDFIYVDRDRISLLISQLNDLGEMTAISEGKEAGRSSEKSDEFKGKGSAIFASGSGAIGSKTSAHHERSIERTYDSRWVNALNFLDEAQHKNLINRDIASARIGEVVLVTGPLRIRDFGSLREIWNKPSMRKSIEAGAVEDQATNRQQRRRAAKNNGDNKKNKSPTDLDMFFDLVEVLPHTTQAMVGDDYVAWGLLKSEGLLGSSSDFALKFGGSIPGDWAMIGLLEALPGGSDLPLDILETTQLDQVGDALFMHLEPLTRQFLGRPSNAYGVTPLIILREVT